MRRGIRVGRSRAAIKTAMRAAKARTREELKRAFKAALELVTESDCSGWFSQCGYQVTLNCISL